jgi:cation:H+ antiporter
MSLASELLALGSEILEVKFGAGFVGSVILGFITMLPELMFVLIAINAGEVDVAVGSAVGGNILLFTIGYGLVIFIAYWKHGAIIELKPTMKDDLWYLVIASFYLLIASIDRKLNLLDGIILVVLYIVFVLHQYWESKRIEHESEHEKEISKKEWYKSGAFMVIGGIIILLIAEPFVEVIIEISDEIKIATIVVALIISPFASEMPEKISAFVLTKKSMKGAEIAIANFIGSKVQASTLLFGLMILLHVIKDNGQDYLDVSDAMFLIFIAVFTTIVGVAVTYDLKLHVNEGIAVMGLYVVSIAAIFLNE